MRPGMEFEGKTVEHAVDDACKKLNFNKEDLKYAVLSYGSTGIFGLVGTKKARIRVTLHEKSLLKEVKGNKPAAAPPVVAPAPAPAPAAAPETEPEAIREKEVADTDISVEKTYDAVENDFDDDENILRCKELLQKILDAITEDAVISVEKNSKGILFNVKGGNAGVLIGKRGQTLEAIQYIIEKIAGKQNDRNFRIHVDVEDYLKTRRENLEKLAERLAQKAARTGKPMTIGQMNAHDRRIVHLFLKSNTAIRTQSLGEGLYRKLMIFPRKKGNERKSVSESK
jgi:spoIIIJ-associated protein